MTDITNHTKHTNHTDPLADAKGARTASSAHALRLRADEIARGMLPDIEPPSGPLSPAAAQKVIHDLRVHQIELELQNDELRRAQESLEGARARYFDLYDLAPVSYFTVSKDGVILEANLAGARLFDVDRTALIGRPLNLFILPEDQDIFYHACRQLDLLGRAQAFELRVANKEGRQFWVWIEAVVAHDEDGVAVWRIVMTDISYRKTMEQALRAADTLRESWMYYRVLAESLPQLVWTSDANGAWDYVGPQWARYTGFPAEEQMALGWLRQVHPDDRSSATAAWNTAIGAGTAFEADFRIRRSDGMYRRFKSRAAPLRGDEGGVNRWFGTSTELEELAVAS
jgi:PAS domain S-box-containing protein